MIDSVDERLHGILLQVVHHPTNNIVRTHLEIINLAAAGVLLDDLVQKKRKKERIGTSRTPVCHLPACRLVRNTLLQSTAATSAS